MPKPKPIGQRYKVGDRVYRKSPDLRADNSSFNARYGTITGVDSLSLIHISEPTRR